MKTKIQMQKNPLLKYSMKANSDLFPFHSTMGFQNETNETPEVTDVT